MPTIDFETAAIQQRPAYPPAPVGVSIKYRGKSAKYWAWGHPTGNNCTKEQARQELTKAYRSKEVKIFHNAKFDMEVAEKYFGLPLLPATEYEDTLLLLFLRDPHSKSLALKPAAEQWLDMPPTERDEVKDWVLANVPGVKPSEWGAHISKAPGALVGKYADGDTGRTEKLAELLLPYIKEHGMVEAYTREKLLLPILIENERVGIRCDVAALERDMPVFNSAIGKAEQWLYKRLKREFNLDSDTEKARALEEAGIVTEWGLTPTGKKSTSKRSMTIDKFNDANVAAVLGYRDRLCTCVRMFGESWLEMASSGDGYLHTNWNQVAQASENGGKKVGTRTGRPSTNNPNFLNVSKTWDDKDDGYRHPTIIKVPPLPLMRRYLLPDKGCLFGHRDYNQQELRTLAHYEDGSLMQAYKADPRMDVHDYVAKEVERIRGISIARRATKITVFRKIYGGGARATAEALKVTLDEGTAIIKAIEAAVPGLRDLEREIKRVGSSGEAIRTWGGRIYYVEPPRFSEKYGRHMTFEYKLLNYLIQGSAADMTKEAILRYHVHPKKRGRFLVTVYDECNTSAPQKHWKQEMAVLKECMESIEIDVPLLTDGKIGPSWGELEKCL